MYFTLNTAFANYLDGLENLTDYLEVPILMNKTTFEEALPVFFNLSKFNSESLISIIINRKFLIDKKGIPIWN